MIFGKRKTIEELKAERAEYGNKIKEIRKRENIKRDIRNIKASVRKNTIVGKAAHYGRVGIQKTANILHQAGTNLQNNIAADRLAASKYPQRKQSYHYPDYSRSPFEQQTAQPIKRTTKKKKTIIIQI